jgi:DNA-directed RNA polymerase subunit H (RpoH/RPB5)
MEIETIRRNIKDMLEARGDDVSYIEEHGDAVEPARFYSETIILDTDKTTVFFALTKDTLKELMKDWKSDDMKSHETLLDTYKGYKQFILVVADQPSSPNMSKLVEIDKGLGNVGGGLHIFNTKELLYNPLKHSLVPLHEKLSEAEGKKVMDLYMVKQKIHMPIISRNDVVARWLGLRQGDIVRITRYNQTSGTYYYYRCCV